MIAERVSGYALFEASELRISKDLEVLDWIKVGHGASIALCLILASLRRNRHLASGMFDKGTSLSNESAKDQVVAEKERNIVNPFGERLTGAI